MNKPIRHTSRTEEARRHDGSACPIVFAQDLLYAG